MRGHNLPVVTKLSRSMAVLPTTFTLEVGKDADHQVRARARSGFGSLTWMSSSAKKKRARTRDGDRRAGFSDFVKAAGIGILWHSPCPGSVLFVITGSLVHHGQSVLTPDCVFIIWQRYSFPIS